MEDYNYPTLPFSKSSVKQICCGNFFTTIVTNKGKVYSTGKNYTHELGFGHKKRVYSFTKNKYFDENNIFVKSVVAGVGFQLFLTHDGSVYACGKNDCFQTGIIPKKNQHEDIKIPTVITSIPKNIYKIYAISTNGYFLTYDGKVYESGDTQKVRRVFYKVNVIQMYCGSQSMHVFCKTKEGKYYTKGVSQDGQLGIGTRINISIPREFEWQFEKIKEFSVSAYHNVVLTYPDENGYSGVYTWGSNYQSKCGLGDCSNYAIPRPVVAIRHLKISRVKAGRSFSIFITDQGNVHISGYLLAFNVNSDINEYPKYFRDLSNVDDVFSGNEHVFFVLRNGDIVVCGSNMEGQLGLGETKRTDCIEYDFTEMPSEKLQDSLKKKITNGECIDVIIKFN